MRRSISGIASVELVIGLIVLIPVILLLFDLSTIAIAVQMNDSTCREAARAAASAAPAQAPARAQAIASAAQQRSFGSMASNFRVVAVTSTAPTLTSQYRGPVSGTVTVQTEVDVRPFLVQWAYESRGPLQFRSLQSYPITYVIP